MSDPSRSKIEYVIFDMDGLLKNLHRRHQYVELTSRIRPRLITTPDVVLAKYGHPGGLTWDIKSWVMGKRESLATYYAPWSYASKASRVSAQYILDSYPGLADKLTVDGYLDERAEMQEALFRKVGPMRGATALVRGLHQAGIPIALATGSSTEFFHYKTSHLPEIFSLFPATSIITADSPEVKPGRGKPFPDIFLAAAHSLGRDVGTVDSCTDAQKAERARGLVFEDAIPGVKAAVAAGMNVVWVPDSELLALNPGEKFGASETLEHLEKWQSSKWGLPPIQPWGKPSSPITISSLPSGALIAFLSRHGKAHTVTPTEVPGRANIAALKSLGVQAIVAFSAVGSLREEIAPGDFIIPDQIIDRTKGIRADTFFRGEGIVAHSMFGDPFSNKLNKLVAPLVRDILEKSEGGPVKLHTGKTVVCMEGPAFSTRAESLMYRQWGGDIINMSVIPEAKLAREAELDYTLICTSTDFDAWRTGHAPVTVEEVVKTLHTNAGNARAVAAGLLQHVHDVVAEGKELDEIKGSMKWSCITGQDAHSAEARKKFSFILPEYYS
ncbi:hypothetical protein P7C73_g5718, partial [Tremellales sp. Uapishka_1]